MPLIPPGRWQLPWNGKPKVTALPSRNHPASKENLGIPQRRDSLGTQKLNVCSAEKICGRMQSCCFCRRCVPSLLCARKFIVGCVEVAKTSGASAQASRSTIHTVHCSRQLIRDRRRTSNAACLTAPYHRCAMQARLFAERLQRGETLFECSDLVPLGNQTPFSSDEV